MTPERTCLAIVLAAGEGTRMRSARPKVLHAVAGRSLLAHVLAAVRAAGGTMTAVVVGPGADAVAAEARRVLPGADDLRAGGAPRHRARGARRQERDRARRRRRPGHLRRYAADPAADADADARGAGRGRGDRGARLPPGGPDRLWAAGAGGRRARRHPRGARRQPGGARARSVQRRPDGVRRPDGARDPRRGSATTIARANTISPMRSRSPGRWGSRRS